MQSSQTIQQIQVVADVHHVELLQMPQYLEQINEHLGLNRSSPCNICAEKQQIHNLVPFVCAEHSFCISCVHAVAINAIRQFKVIKCPNDTCLQQFNESSPYFAELSAENKEKYLKILKNKRILQNSNVRLCSKPNCEGHYLMSTTKLKCSECNQQYCRLCLQPTHTGNCDRLVARGMKKRYKFRKCPQCRMVVQRTEGCDHMTCYCLHQFCYKCGQSYLHGSHACTKPPHLKGFASFRWEIQLNSSAFQSSVMNLSRILYFLQPKEEASTMYRLIYTFLFIITLYPILSSLATGAVLLAVTLYCLIAIIAISSYFLLLPIMEVYHLQLSPARFLRRKNVPTIIIRLLTIPLYPINFFFGIKDKSQFLTCEGEVGRAKSLLNIIRFFFALPFLMNANSE